MKIVASIAFNIILALLALHAGYFMGFNDGWDKGHKVGVIDQTFAAKGLCFKHNGKCE